MSDETPEITDPSAFSNSSLAIQVVLAVVTLGLYAVYWIYKTNAQLGEGTTADPSPVLRTIGSIVPIVNFVVAWKMGQDAEAVTDQDGVLLFVLFVVFAPAAWYLIQSGINDVATGAGT